MSAAVSAVPIYVHVEQGRFSVERGKDGAVLLKFKPHIWPEVQIVIPPLEAASLVDAVEFFL